MEGSAAGRAGARRGLSQLTRILLVGDVAAPGGVAARGVGLLVGDLGGKVPGGGTVPVVLARLDVDAVARAPLLDRPSLPLDQAGSFGDEDRLAGRVGMPRRAGSRREVDNSLHDP